MSFVSIYKDPRGTVARGDQPSQPGESLIGSAGALGVATGMGATGFIHTKTGRIWDNYISAIRSVETGSPGAVLRTFRTSEFLSPLETWSKTTITPEMMQSRGSYGDYLRNRLGEGSAGGTIKRTGSVIGSVYDADNKLVGFSLNTASGTQRGEAIVDYFARITGTKISEDLSIGEGALFSEWEATARKQGISFDEWKKFPENRIRQPKIPLITKLRSEVNIFDKKILLSETTSQRIAKAELVSTYVRAKAATTVGRLNNLLQKPFEIPGLGKQLEKIPFVRSMAIEQGTSMQMWGRYIKKGIAAMAIWKGTEYYDYLRANNQSAATVVGTAGGAALGGFLLKRGIQGFNAKAGVAGAAVGLYTALSPRFEKGFFHGAASYVADANITRAKVSDNIGLTEQLQKQNKITPGLITPEAMLASTGVGALAGGLWSYAGFAKDSAIVGFSKKIPMHEVFGQLRSERKLKFAEKFTSGLGSKLAKIPGIGKHLSKSPAAVGALAGLATWTAVSSGASLLSGNILAAIPGLNILGSDETEKQLQKWYSGEEEVGIRKGRWWEFGRCLSQDTEIITDFGKTKLAKEIQVGDGLLDSDGNISKVLNVWTRSHSGLIYSVFTAYDKNKSTSITGNHKVPVLTNEHFYDYILVRKEAKDINVGEFVQIPLPALYTNLLSINTEDYIKVGLYLLDKENIYPAQKNWHSEKIRRSRGSSIPREIQLTPELGRLFGYYLAEGNLSYKNDIPHMIETVHAKSERWIVDDIISISEKEFNIIPTVRFKKGNKKTDKGCWVVRICSSLLARVFFELFYHSDRKQDKLFPSIFMSAPKNFKEQLIEGYWRGDGHLENNTRIISSCRKELLVNIQTILLTEGYYPTIDRFESNNYRGRYKLRWRPDKEYSGRGFHNLFRWFDNKLFVKVQSISIEEYDDIVYDFEVSHSDHLFVAGTFLVHNSSSYAGGKVDYYRQHFMARLGSRSYQKGLWGDEEKRWEHDPIMNPVKAIFGSDEWKYAYEIEHQYDRPAPLTKTYGEDIPFIGPLFAATIGKMLKPRKLVRPEEWMNKDGTVIHHPKRSDLEPVYQLGGLQAGAPISPDSASQLFNELNYRRREAVGLVGFAEGAIQNKLTGREEIFENKQTLATMGAELSSESWLWDHMNLGGGFFSTEAIRRFTPHERSYLQDYNPLETALPSWMPKDYFMDYSHGNPIEKIKEGEIRLPGSGLAALHPELKGVNPEDYSLAWKTKVLGDTAMWSDEYRSTMKMALANRKNMSEAEVNMVETTRQQVINKKKKREFNELQFRDEELERMNLTVSEVLSPREIRTEELGGMIVRLRGVGSVTGDMTDAMAAATEKLKGRNIEFAVSALEGRRYEDSAGGPVMNAVAMLGDTPYGSSMAKDGFTEEQPLEDEFSQLQYTKGERLSGKLGEFYSRSLSTPMEYLTPMSPASKFYRQRTAIEDFIATEAIGTGNAFWDRPIENFFSPAAEMAEYKLGDKEIPKPVQQRRAVQEYFDALAYIKKQKTKKALADEDYQDWEKEYAQKYIKEYRPSIWDFNPYSNPSAVMQAMPRNHRDFFKAFSDAKTEEDREKIISIVPREEQRVYIAQWAKQEQEALIAKKEAGISTKEDDQALAELSVMRKTGGYGITENLEKQWMQETQGKIPYDQWITKKKTQEYFATRTMPGPDWIGWHPAVDLKDIQVQYVTNEGMDYHDFDLWGDRVKSLARKPYINGADDSLEGADSLAAAMEEESEMIQNAKTLSSFIGKGNSGIMVSRINANINSQFDVNISDGRKSIVVGAYDNMSAKTLRDY